MHGTFDEVHEGVVVLLDGISVRDHQNDSPRSPKHICVSDISDPSDADDSTRDQKKSSDRHYVVRHAHLRSLMADGQCRGNQTPVNDITGVRAKEKGSVSAPIQAVTRMTND